MLSRMVTIVYPIRYRFNRKLFSLKTYCHTRSSVPGDLVPQGMVPYMVIQRRDPGSPDRYHTSGHFLDVMR